MTTPHHWFVNSGNNFWSILPHKIFFERFICLCASNRWIQFFFFEKLFFICSIAKSLKWLLFNVISHSAFDSEHHYWGGGFPKSFIFQARHCPLCRPFVKHINFSPSRFSLQHIELFVPLRHLPAVPRIRFQFLTLFGFTFNDCELDIGLDKPWFKIV